MPGMVTALDVKQGQTVKSGENLLVLEAMKMENTLVAPFDGIVAELNVAPGAQVRRRRGAGADRERTKSMMAGRNSANGRSATRIAHALHHTVTEDENRDFTLMTRNPQPLHLDAEYAATTEFGRIVVNGLFTFSLMVGVSVDDTTLGTLVANLGYDKVAMPKPVFIGDVLRFETEVDGAARIQVAAQCRHCHLPPSRLQPARRAGVRVLCAPRW